MATEKFQQLIWQILKDCPGPHNLHDDLRVVGRDQKEHDENLDRVMRKFEENGLTPDYDKCVIGADSMIYMGEVLTRRWAAGLEGESRELTNRRLLHDDAVGSRHSSESPSCSFFELTIHSKDDDVGTRAANFPAISEVCFSIFTCSQAGLKRKCLTSEKRELVSHMLFKTTL